MDPREAFSKRDEVVLLDVREPREWAAGRIEGSQHVPMWQLPGRLGEIDTGRPVVCVCRTGNRSEQVSQWLRAQGYEAHNLEGGVVDWTASGLPFEGEVV